MKNASKAILALLLAVGLFVSFPHGVVGVSSSVPLVAQAAGDDGTTNWDFIEPVTHLTTVPAGYIGIYSAQDLFDLGSATGYPLNAILMNNISLSGYNCAPIKKYLDEFDGNGYAISNMNISVTLDEFYEYEYEGVGYFRYSVGLPNSSLIKNLSLTGQINVTIQGEKISKTVDLYCGGLAGRTNGTIENCIIGTNINIISTTKWSFGETYGYGVNVYVGGVSGIQNTYNYEKTENCIFTGTIDARGSMAAYIGGIAGIFSGGNIINCVNFGSIYASATPISEYNGGYGLVYAGGITGKLDGVCRVSDCFNTGAITAIADGFSVGGLLGFCMSTAMTVEGCYNAGKILTNMMAGRPDGFLYSGGIAGETVFYSSGTTLVKNCYFLDSTEEKAIGYVSGTPRTENIAALTDTQMRQQASFVGFDFVNVWEMPVDGGYPVLKGMQGITVPDPGNVPVTGVTLDQSTLSLDVSTGIMLYATIIPATATNKAVVWTSSDEQVATVNNGAITAKKVGSATITVSTVDGGFNASCIVTVNIYNIGEETYRFNNYSDSDSDGHCFGMSATSSAYHLRLLDIAIIGGNYNQGLYELEATSIVKEPICYYQPRQGIYALQATVAGGRDYKGETPNITSDWAEVVNYVKNHAYDDKGALQIGYKGVTQNGKSGGHAINFLRYSEVGGQPRIYAYDNNYPNGETYFYKDEEGMIRQEPYSTFSRSINCIALRDVSTYFSAVGGYDATRVIYADRDVISVVGASAYPMDGGIEYREHVVFDIPAQLNQVTIIPLIDNATFKYLDKVYSFGKIYDDTVGIFKLSTLGENPSLTITSSHNTPVISGPTTLDYKGTITLTADKPVNFTTDSQYITLEKVNDTTVKVTSVKSFIKNGSAEIKATPAGGGEAATVTVKVKPTIMQWLMIIFLFGWYWM